MIQRSLYQLIKEKLNRGKEIFIIGLHQVGKTTLMKLIGELSNEKFIYLNCDEPDIRDFLTSPNSSQLKSIFKDYKLIPMDVVQKVKDIGITIKIIVDMLPVIR